MVTLKLRFFGLTWYTVPIPNYDTSRVKRDLCRKLLCCDLNVLFGSGRLRAQWRRGAATSREAASALAARAPGQKLSDAEKLEKHRMLVRRSYYQKKVRP